MLVSDRKDLLGVSRVEVGRGHLFVFKARRIYGIRKVPHNK